MAAGNLNCLLGLCGSRESHMETAIWRNGCHFWNDVLNFSSLALKTGDLEWAVWYMRASWDLLASLGFKRVLYIVEVDSLDHLQYANTTQLNQLLQACTLIRNVDVDLIDIFQAHSRSSSTLISLLPCFRFLSLLLR